MEVSYRDRNRTAQKDDKHHKPVFIVVHNDDKGLNCDLCDTSDKLIIRVRNCITALHFAIVKVLYLCALHADIKAHCTNSAQI